MFVLGANKKKAVSRNLSENISHWPKYENMIGINQMAKDLQKSNFESRQYHNA